MSDLSDIKEGDKVVVYSGYSSFTGHRMAIKEVSRTTPTMIMIRISDSYEARYYKKDGRIVSGDRWSRGHIGRVTPEVLGLMEIEKLKRKAVYARDNLSIPETREGLEAFIEALLPFLPKK